MPVDEVNAWCVFVQCWAGGAVPVTLIELERFRNILCKIPAAMWLYICLSKLNITAYMYPVKSMLSSPLARKQSKSKSWSVADVGNIFWDA